MNRITLSVSVLLISLNCYAVVGIPVEEPVKDDRKESVKELTAEEKAEKLMKKKMMIFYRKKLQINAK